MRLKTTALFAATALLCAAAVHAQSNEQLKSAAQKAVSTNPDVTARFNAYRAAADAVDVVRGGYYPRVDLNANVGRDRDNITSRSPETQSLSRTSASLTLTQLLWDGLATPNEVGRLGHEKMARYFELLDATEQTTLEAARAYYDVLRFRRLVTLAEENYVQHRSAFNQIQSRFKAGVGRGVDLEQAGARLALAEANLSTEAANLHDVSARYQRVVGEAPPSQMSMPPALSGALPADASGASAEAIRRSAAISASVESLRGARALASVREGAYQPRVEARVRSGAGRSFDGVRDQNRDSTAEIVLNWNLFNGGSDRARVRQQANAVNQAADLRDKACRDARQVVEIAYNDTRKLTDQLTFLDRNTLAIEKARNAYRQQFDISQRSLLDLLNSENELYTARRSYANAEYDLGIAYARTHASMQQLSSQLGLTRADTSIEAPQEAEDWNVGDDSPGRCPASAVEIPRINMEALAARAAALTSGSAAALPSDVARRTTATSAAVAPLDSTIGGTPAYLSVRRLNDWAAAWEAKDVQRYMSFYAPGFTPSKGNVDAWKARRRALIRKKGPISVRLEGVQTSTLAADRVETRFTQTYNSNDFKDITAKVLTWQQAHGEWFIVKESDR